MGDIIRQELERDKKTKLCVLSLVHNTHPAATEFLDDPVVRHGLAHKLGKSRHWRECYDAIVARSIGRV